MNPPIRTLTLVSMPWPLYDRPSIQLGTLKAYLAAQMPQVTVQAVHFYLKVAAEVGYDLYRAISKRTWLAESVYAALLFPQRRERIEKIFRREARKDATLRHMDFDQVCSRVAKASQGLINGVDWQKSDLVGFSVCLCQLTASLYAIKKIKKRFSSLPVVVGGSMFSGNQASGLVRCFPEVDFVVNGEGERPLTALVRFLNADHGTPRPSSLPAVAGRADLTGDTHQAFDQMDDLDGLPPPDYDDYFALLKSMGPDKAFFPTLPAEISRGCWWRSGKAARKVKGCAFCNLNLQWDGYRSKQTGQVVAEIDHLTTRYQVLSVAFTDNLLPARRSKEIFQRLSTLGKDMRFFAEVRATIPYPVLKAMKDAGTHELQIGIEALSTNLLKKLNKGTTAIQNLEAMKSCEELGIAHHSNLILYFPASDAQDVEQTLRTLEFALPFQPLRCVAFWLGLGSPGWLNPQAFGLKAVLNHPNYRALFPQEIFRHMTFMIQSYQNGLGYQM
ncbi:MAG: RiPP maturation radical SAM C-methyltransferase, partial [Deltaproteobacteria bacterium]|nr:RiPP maturation radical SAM C-methyltransferase [Deltaproteobacteria bacterium]